MTQSISEDPEERRVLNSFKTYIEKGTQPLNWITGIIRSSKIRDENLKSIFTRLEEYSRNRDEKLRFQEVYEQCKQEGWLTS